MLTVEQILFHSQPPCAPFCDTRIRVNAGCERRFRIQTGKSLEGKKGVPVDCRYSNQNECSEVDLWLELITSVHYV